MAWVVLVASAAAVALTGLAATLFVFGALAGPGPSIGAAFWARFLAGCALTIASLSIRSLRWVFLLRRAEARLPIRDAYIGYFAGLSLLFAPFLVGEIAVRALVQRTRGGVPVATTIVVNLWERFLDVAALAAIAAVYGLVTIGVTTWTVAAAAMAAATLMAPLRRLALRAAVGAASAAARLVDRRPTAGVDRLGSTPTWLAALAASIAAWVLPGLGFWLISNSWDGMLGAVTAIGTYAVATGRGFALVPAGVIVAGASMIETLADAGFSASEAALAVLAVRLATVGVATTLGALFVLVHFMSARPIDAAHFDAIADAYDVQIPEGRRLALLRLKTEMMQDVLTRAGGGRRGLDVGCGQGAYVARMRELGFDVTGIDASAGQVALAARNVGGAGLVTTGSVLDVPAPDASYDFVYVINVLHHLSSVDEQRRAFKELVRVLRPGGLLFVHEINTRNIVFRFYMGYVFPSLNCIDEGIERWLLPNELAVYTDVPVAEVRYFTFLPDFLPQAIAGLLAPVERSLERSRLGVYSAHYMAVLRRGGA
jgi:ubiquinone/menaquinone biosynthesis C-methylase UbiE